MNVYVTYDRYERNEWLSVYSIETSKKRAIKKFLEEDLFGFLSYGPDDCHSFQLQRVWMTKKQYERLCFLVEHETDRENGELKEMLVSMFEEDTDVFSEFEIIYSTDGCSDNFEVVDFYIQNYIIEDIDVNDFDDEDEYRDAVSEKFYNDEDLYEKVIKDYIRFTYR